MWHEMHRALLSVLVSIRAGGCYTWRCRAGQVEDVFLIDASVAEIKSLPAVGFRSSVMMTSCCQVALLLSLAVAVSVYAGNQCGTFYHLNLNIYGQNLKCCVWCVSPWQTWNWTVCLIMWCLCGPQTDTRLTRRSFVWGLASLPAWRRGRPSSMFTSATATSGDWWLMVPPGNCETPLCSAVCCHSDAFHRLLGIGCCTPTIWLTVPLPKSTLCLSVNQSSVNMRGGCTKHISI